MESWNNQILCGNTYNLQQDITPNNCTDCGCDKLLQSMNYINNNQQLEMNYDIECCTEYEDTINDECIRITTTEVRQQKQIIH